MIQIPTIQKALILNKINIQVKTMELDVNTGIHKILYQKMIYIYKHFSYTGLVFDQAQVPNNV